MNILFVGAVEFSHCVLQVLVEMRANVVGVCTLEKSDFNADHRDLRFLCEANDIPWVYAPDINSEESIRWIKEKAPDVIFCWGWSRLIREELLALAPLGVIGFHPAALPANRGRHPLIWALVLGLKKTAATFFFMDEGADSGDILSQREVAIDDEDDAATLYEKVTECALVQIREFVPQLVSGKYYRTKQDHRFANTWRKRGKADGKIDWRMSASSVHNLVRGLAKPYVGAHFLYGEQEVKVWRTMVVDDLPDNIEPGKIIADSALGPVVKCGMQGIRLLDFSPSVSLKIGDYL